MLVKAQKQSEKQKTSKNWRPTPRRWHSPAGLPAICCRSFLAATDVLAPGDKSRGCGRLKGLGRCSLRRWARVDADLHLGRRETEGLWGGGGYRRSTTHWRLSTRHFHPKTALNTVTPCPPEKCTRSTRIECTRLVLKKISFQMLHLPSWLQLLLSHEVQLVSETLGHPKPSFPS